jgi:hypothetical protein
MKLMVIGAFIAGLVLLSFLLSFPLMLLWNWCLVPAVTGLNEVGWLQMWGITLLISAAVQPIRSST